ncbi:MAG: RluA family pseudouridine synthase [Actinobacteria bacterium]|nr:RluA family pseudouridine synthase [Actinomycetota bacterium]
MSALARSLRLEAMSSLEGERLDRGLALLTGLSRAEASRLVSAGKVSLRGVLASSGSRRLHAGDELLVELGDTLSERAPTEPGFGSIGPSGRVHDAAGMPPLVEAAVVFADAHLVVVDKPAGLVVHPGAGNRSGTLVQQLVAAFPDIAAAGPDSTRPGVVHRLDKGTSGLLVVARTSQAREALARQMAAHLTLRRYLTVVHGEMAADEGLIEAPLGRSPRQRTRVGVVEGGRPARTRYVVLDRSSSAFPATFVTCRLETGRTHQVRVHLRAIGHAVVGDDVYASRSQSALVHQWLPFLSRPWLHATELSFAHPVTGEQMKFISPPPAELHEALGLLGLGHQP